MDIKKDNKNNKKADPFEEIVEILDDYNKGNPPRTLDDYETCC